MSGVDVLAPPRDPSLVAALSREAARRYAQDKRLAEASRVKRARVHHAQRVLDAAMARCPRCDALTLPALAAHTCSRR